jgi:hypothetical protein
MPNILRLMNQRSSELEHIEGHARPIRRKRDGKKREWAQELLVKKTTYAMNPTSTSV